ncbi:MAG: hypothetical protein AAFQ91_23025 [Cyanobacteria bacterium J06621_15]
MKPKPIIEFQQLAISFFAGEILPAFMTSNFLRESRIIPEEWEFAKPPEIDTQSGNVVFTNDVYISADIGTVTFSEYLNTTNIDDAKVPNLASKWVNTLSRLSYQGAEISFNSFVTFERKNHSFGHYIPNRLLVNGDWKEVSEEPLRASLSLAYTLKDQNFDLKIDDVRLRGSDDSLQSGVMFCGNFPYELNGNTAVEKLKHINQLLELWQEDLEVYQNIVDKKFLKLNKN